MERKGGGEWLKGGEEGRAEGVRELGTPALGKPHGPEGSCASRSLRNAALSSCCLVFLLSPELGRGFCFICPASFHRLCFSCKARVRDFC